jgi:hypothetical protein
MKLPTPNDIKEKQAAVTRDAADDLLLLIEENLNKGNTMFSYAEIINEDNKFISKAEIKKLLDPILKEFGWEVEWRTGDVISLLEVKVKVKNKRWFGRLV